MGGLQDAGSAVLFISPHLDDAILSCGALLAHLAHTCPVTVVTVFSSGSPPPRLGISARRQLRALGVTDAEAYFNERQAEDISVLEEIGVPWIHLGLREALSRRVGEASTGPSGRGRATYPTFRYHAGRGRIARSDFKLTAEVGAMLRQVVVDSDAKVVFGPLGIGRHVDHLITRDVVTGLNLCSVYYSDFPYSERSLPDPNFIRRATLTAYQWSSGRVENEKRIAGYKTQAPLLFPDGIPITPEAYWIPAKDSAADSDD